MGMDVYGLNPKINKDYSPRYNEIIKKYGAGDGWLDWQKDIPQDVKDEYFKLKDKFGEDNPGDYFRNNVWWWRPLWSFVCSSCDDFLSAKDMECGSYNDGKKIAKYKAIKIGKRLSEKLADGTVDMIHRKYELASAKAKVHNKIVDKEMDRITDACHKEHGDNLVPANYPEPYKTQWSDAYNNKSWDDSYPFNKDNVENFAKFCIESGGFQIC